MLSNTKSISLAVTAGLLSASLALPITLAFAEEYSGDHPFTAAEAELIHQGKIVYDDGSSTGLVDLSLINGAVMNPEGDDDFDGIKNKDELHIYTKNGQQYLHYLSHPKLRDTDGDGLADKEDPDKLSWDIHAHDGVIFQELTYRDDSYQLKVLGQDALDGKQSVEDAYDKTMVPLPQNQWHDGRKHYGLMRREVAPFWNAVRSWHTGSGFDATMYEFSNKTFPYLKDKSVHVLGIRGTAGAKDVGVDISLGLGQWMGQDTDAQNVAKELVNQQQRFKNITVTGHSLGGYLSQMFFVASLGGKYGDKSENGEDNYNYWNQDKVYNPEVKHVFGFNAPRIQYNGFNKSLKEYYWLGKFLDNKFNNTYFQVNNDSIVRSHPDKVTYIGNSDAGHSSLSFWEKKFAKLDGFSIGERNDLSGLGYQEPALKRVRFVHRTIVKIKENGKDLAEVILPKTKDEIAAINKDKLSEQIDPDISIDGPVNLKYGEINTLNGSFKQIHVTYKFVVEGEANPVATEVVKTKYKTDYVAPSVPKSTDPDYEYVSQVNPMPKVPKDELTKDKEITVTLIKKPVKINTKVIFKDGDNTVKTITKESKPSEGNPKLVDSDFPEGYVIPDPLPTLTAGQDNEIKLTPKEFTLTFKYVDVTKNNTVVGNPDSEKVRYGKDSQYRLKIPKGYQLADNYTFINPTDVKADAVVEIQIKPEQSNEWQLSFVYQHNGKNVGTQVTTVKAGEKVDLQLPSHSDSNKSYILKNPADSPYIVAGPRPATGKQSVDIAVQEKVAATPINPDTVIHYYNITINYVYEGKQVKSETKHLRQDTPIVLSMPTSSSGTYKVADNAQIPSTATKTETINVPLTFTPNVYEVIIRYVYTKDGVSRVLEVEKQQVEDAKKPVIKERINGGSAGRYYQPKKDYKAPTVNGSLVVDVPLEYIVESHNVTVKYMDGETQVGADEVQKVKDGETTSLKLPTATGFDGHYVLAEDFDNPIITGDQVLKVPLKRQINSYEVTINYQLDGKTKADSFQMVESGKTAENDYEFLIKSSDDQAIKEELSKYEVDPTYDWSVKITKKTTLNVPLKRKVQIINVPPKPAVKDPCGVNKASWDKPADSKQITWKIKADKRLVASTTDGYVFDRDSAPAGVGVSEDGKTADYGMATVDSGVICWTTIQKLPVLEGVADKTVSYGASFDPRVGVKATGGEGADLTSQIMIEGTVDTATPGTYRITYSVMENGAKVSKTITVTVKEKSVTPDNSLSVLKIVEGVGQNWIKDSTNLATFKSNGTYDPAVVKVYIDGKLLPAQYYSSSSGSVVVNLKPSYLNTLALGKHTIGIASKEGIASTYFYILPKSEVANMPVTNKPANTGTHGVLVAGFGVLLAACGLFLCHHRGRIE